MSARVPHLRIVMAASIAAILGYVGFSIWVVLVSKDPALTGDVVGTWKSFAVAAFTFWLGSSSAGKARTEYGPDAPIPTEVVNTPANPVPVAAGQPDDSEGAKP